MISLTAQFSNDVLHQPLYTVHTPITTIGDVNFVNIKNQEIYNSVIVIFQVV